MISNLLLQRRYLGNCSKRTRQDGKRLVGRPLRQFTTSSSVPLHKKKQNKAKLKGNRIKLCIHFWRICRQVFTIMYRKRSKTVCPVFFFFFWHDENRNVISMIVKSARSLYYVALTLYDQEKLLVILLLVYKHAPVIFALKVNVPLFLQKWSLSGSDLQCLT